MNKDKISNLVQSQNNSVSEVEFHRGTSIALSAHFFIQKCSEVLKKTNSIPFVAHKCLKLATKSSQIKGIRIQCSGRLRGIDRARSISFATGEIARQNLNTRVDYAYQPVLTKAGLLGLKIWVAFHSKKNNAISKKYKIS